MPTTIQELERVEARKPYPPTASLEKSGKDSKRSKPQGGAFEDDQPPPPYDSHHEYRQESGGDVQRMSTRSSLPGPLPACAKHDDSNHSLKQDLIDLKHDLKQLKQLKQLKELKQLKHDMKRDLKHSFKHRHHLGHHHHFQHYHSSKMTDEPTRGRERCRGRTGSWQRDSSTSSDSSSSSSRSRNSHEGARQLKQGLKQIVQRLRGKV